MWVVQIITEYKGGFTLCEVRQLITAALALRMIQDSRSKELY